MNKASVLVIDDEEIMRDSCSQVLEKEGIIVDTAEDGASGLETIKNKSPDAALVDLKMPGIDGLELLSRIQEADPEIVCVVITGYPTIESAVESMKRGAYDFLPKPFSPEELRIVVHRAIERRKLALESARLRLEKEKMQEYFITLVTHELRSPLATIQQYLSTILGGYVGGITDQQTEILQNCSNQGKSLLKLIEDWLCLSRVEEGLLVEQFEPLSISSILTKVVDQQETTAEVKGVSIHLRMQDDLPLIQGDVDTLELVFNNLIGNGIKFNVEGGTVDIEARADNQHVAIDVKDTGIGISQENLPSIFDEFYRGNNPSIRLIPGSGLGLPIVNKILQAHSARIRVASELGKGSTFSVLFPVESGTNLESNVRQQDSASVR
ncbi:sensor histidine kinase [Candidatus Neomarinimicrobiota bacterium]